MSAPFERVLVAVDDSVYARRALEVAGALAASTNADLVVVHVVGLIEGAAHGELQVGEWCAPLRAAGVGHRVEVVPGSPVPALLAAIDRLGADLVVVGTRGAGGIGTSQLGSTSLELVHEAPVPVLVVPAPR